MLEFLGRLRHHSNARKTCRLLVGESVAHLYASETEKKNLACQSSEKIPLAYLSKTNFMKNFSSLRKNSK